MLILHATAVDGRLFLWGERPVDNAPSSSTSPFDPGPEPLTEALADIVGKTTRAASEVRTIWLPTTGGVQIPSSPLIAEPPDESAVVELASWSVTTIPLGATQTIDLLSAGVDGSPLAPGIFPGKSLSYWANVLRFAGSLVARQNYLPSLAERNGSWYAHWQPVLTGVDREAVDALAASMPHACRAMGEAAEAPSIPATVVLESVIGWLVDGIVRRNQAVPAGSEKILHDRWLHALVSTDGKVDGDPAEIDDLVKRWREWTRPVTLTQNAPFRLCFRLEEPEEPTLGTHPASFLGTPPEAGGGGEEFLNSWTLRYLLQAIDDPSLLIPVDKAWSPKGRTVSVLARRSFEPREFLLTALGQAARICPQIDESMRGSAPSTAALTTEAAFYFLSEQAFLLEQVGFGVMLPRWWTRKGARTRLSSRAKVKAPKMQSTAGLTLDAVVNFEWEVAVGDHTLTRSELETLAIQKAGLVKVRGQWVQIDAAEIQAVLKVLKNRTGSMTARDVVRLALGGSPDGGQGVIPVDGVDAGGWVGDLLSKLTTEAALEQTPPPPDFHATLRPYQERGYSWMNFLRQWGFGACLADDMGLGKTVQVLAHVLNAWAAGERRPTLVISPTSVVGNWKKEAERFAPSIPVMVHHGATRLRGEKFVDDASAHGLVLSSYALLQRDFEHLSRVDWAAVILDEAQNIKNPETKQSKAARALGNPSSSPSPKRRGEIGEENEVGAGGMAPARIVLTGTPVENHVGDLWSIMEFANPGFLGTQAEFKRNFFNPIQSGENPEAAGQLKKLTAPFILRRLKSDKSIIADLPEKNEMRVFCTLTKEQASLYQAVVKDTEEALKDSEGIQRRGLILATLARLKQVCNHPAQFLGDNSAVPGRSGKLARLQEMVEELLDAGDRALIFSQFFEMGEIIRRHLQETFGREVLFLHGGVDKDKRDRMVDRFQKDDGPRLFILSLKAGGTGLTLTNANHVFHFDRWWNPAVENQATDRAYRIGQKKQVQVHKFVCAGTLEERIDEMIESKQKLAANVVGTGEDWLTEMSTAELKQLFKLRDEAIQ